MCEKSYKPLKSGFAAFLIGAITLLALALTRYASAESDRFDEYVVVARHVPHEVTRRWPVGDKIGLDLLVKRGTTDKQLAELVRWYVSVGAKVIAIYDNRADASERAGMIATYDAGELSRLIYRHGEWLDTRSIPLSPPPAPSAEATPSMTPIKFPPPAP